MAPGSGDPRPADWMMLRWEVYRNHTNYEPLMDSMLGRSYPEIWEVFVNRVFVNGRYPWAIRFRS
jgi:hypothetical protein